ncbi:MAG: sporulation protein YqfD [Christensenellales bacterium]|jgi:similar to stage IV sporulation protein
MIWGGVKFKIKSVNQERLFSSLAKEEKIFNISRKSHTESTFIINFKTEKKIEKFLKNNNIEILEKQQFGLLSKILLVLKNWGVIFGLFCGLLGVLITSNFILDTQILGLEKLEKSQIESVLKQNNVSFFSNKKSIKTKQIEENIMKSFDQVGLVSVIIKGNTLIVSIKEKMSAGEYDNPQDLKPLIALQSGQITSIELIEGTPMVKVGDIVKAGDVLVQPYIIDSSGNKKIVKANAVITAKVWLVGREVHYENRFETVKTGKKYTHTNLFFLNINLMPQMPENVFTSYEVTKTRVNISNNNFLPIIREKIVLEETVSVQVKESFESVKDKIFAKAKQKALHLVEEYDIINKEYFTVTSNSGITHVEYVFEVIKNIA